MSLSVKTLMRKLEEQGGRCALTGRPLHPDDCALDHIDPLSGDGAHDISNLQIVTQQVNRAKGTMSQQEFIDMCIDVAMTHGAIVNVSR